MLFSFYLFFKKGVDFFMSKKAIFAPPGKGQLPPVPPCSGVPGKHLSLWYDVVQT